MQDIQRLLDEQVRKMPEMILARMIQEKFAAQNHTISEKVAARIARKIANGGGNGFVWTWDFWRRTAITFGDEDIAGLEKRLDAVLENRLGPMVGEVTDQITETFLKGSRHIWDRELKIEAKDRRGFERRLMERWGAGLKSLRLLLGVSREFGSDFGMEVWPVLRQDKPHLADVLFRSQARACQITDAVLVLLSHGFADDAMARWRSLHEIATTLSLVTEHGETLAERYVLYQWVEKHRSINDYAVVVRDWGYEPMAPAEIDRIMKGYDAVVARFGPQFKGWYGWAAEHLAKANPTFRDIEEAAGRAAWRATYKWASRNVHASAAAAYDRLGVFAGNPTALAGPSNAGLADPGHATALALIQVNTALLPFLRTADSVVFGKLMMRLADEIGDLLLAAHRQLAEDEERLRPTRYSRQADRQRQEA